jgi:subtilisin family serine protease
MGRIPMRPLAATFTALFSVTLMTLGTAAPAGASDDTYFAEQWGLTQIHAPDAWTSATGAGITIAIIDTGVENTHPDLRGKIDATANCVSGTCYAGGAEDVHGHGTLVAGIAAASTGNSRGVAGVAPEARLVVAKAVDDSGRGSVEAINAGIRWAVDRGARVINLSLGDPNFLVTSLLGTPLRPGIDYAWSRGAIPVIASGNENVGLLELGSANYGSLNALVVGATERSGAVASYSSPIGNAKWGLVAPGGSGDGAGTDILSTYRGGGYAWVAGTSMAAPHVSGALALLLSRGLSPTAAVERILSTVDKSVRCGAGCQGRLDVAPAMAGIGTASTPTTPSAGTGTTAAGGGRPAGTTATTRPPATSTTTAPAAPPGTGPAGSELAAPGPESLALSGRSLEYSGDAARSTAVLAMAIGLAVTSGAVTGAVTWRRLRAGERW